MSRTRLGRLPGFAHGRETARAEASEWFASIVRGMGRVSDSAGALASLVFFKDGFIVALLGDLLKIVALVVDADLAVRFIGFTFDVGGGPAKPGDPSLSPQSLKEKQQRLAGKREDDDVHGLLPFLLSVDEVWCPKGPFHPISSSVASFSSSCPKPLTTSNGDETKRQFAWGVMGDFFLVALTFGPLGLAGPVLSLFLFLSAADRENEVFLLLTFTLLRPLPLSLLLKMLLLFLLLLVLLPLLCVPPQVMPWSALLTESSRGSP